MNIKEIIDAERWSQKRRDGWWEVKHNASLNRIEASVTARIKELQFTIIEQYGRIKELESKRGDK